MKFSISKIREKFGIRVFSGVIDEGAIMLGQEVEIRSGERVFGPALICGVVVGGKSMDYAAAGTSVECTMRGSGVNQAKVGDLVRLRTLEHASS